MFCAPGPSKNYVGGAELSTFIDENDGFDHVRGARGLYGVGRFIAAQFSALSSAKKLNSTDLELMNAPVLHSAQAKLEVFRRIVSGQMAQGKMMQDCRLAGVVLNAGKKKSTFGACGVALADEALEVVRDFAKRDGADIFLISGTLLGPVRDGHLIRHDYDLDFGVFSGDPGMDKFEQSLRRDPRFDVRKTFRITPELSHYNRYMEGHTGKPLKYTILYKGAVTIDIFVHLRYGNTIYHGTDRNILLNSSFSLASMDINNKTYLVPDNPAQYLKENYGTGVNLSPIIIAQPTRLTAELSYLTGRFSTAPKIKCGLSVPAMTAGPGSFTGILKRWVLV
jgi:hypothetical protein